MKKILSKTFDNVLSTGKKAVNSHVVQKATEIATELAKEEISEKYKQVTFISKVYMYLGTAVVGSVLVAILVMIYNMLS